MVVGWVQTLIEGLNLFVSTRQYLALFLLLLVEEAGVPLPLPGDTVIMFLGYRAAIGLATPILVILDVAMATFLGSSILYFVARRIGHPAVVRYGRYIRLDEKRLAKVEGWFARHGTLAIVFGRLIPGLRTPTSVAAGIFEIPYGVFARAAALSAFLWAMIYMALGAMLGTSYHRLIGLSASYRSLALLVGLLVVLAVTTHLVARSWGQRLAGLSTRRPPVRMLSRRQYLALDKPTEAR